ncbi:hypothetical protein ABZ958_05545 [Streptomyces sp. NPDC046237]|uniref:hypothetical protein n=1 Tax=Streptomyces sp. NPDC046237 TaxID=3154914 RepID=UPI0033C4384C
MSGDPDRRARILTLGCLYTIIVAVLLLVIGLVLASVMVTSFFDRPAEPKNTSPDRGAAVLQLGRATA